MFPLKRATFFYAEERRLNKRGKCIRYRTHTTLEAQSADLAITLDVTFPVSME